MKKNLQRLLLCSIVLLLLNCQSEDLALDSHEHSKLKIQRISLEDLKSKPKAFEALNAIKGKGKTDAQAKLVYNSLYDFYVDTEEIVYIEKEESHSYTFAVYRKEKTAFFENLVMTQQEDGSYSATLVSYNLTEQERYDLDHEQLYSLEGKMSAIALDSRSIDQELLLNRLSCITIEIPTCSYGEGGVHFAGPGCTQVDGTYSITACTNVSEPQAPISYISGPSGPGGDGGGSGGSGGSTPNPQTPITPEPTNPTPQPDPSSPIGEIGDITVPLIKPSPIERFIAGLSDEQEEWLNDDVIDYVIANNYSEESKNYAEEILDAVADYIDEYGETGETITIANDFIESVLGDEEAVNEEDIENTTLAFPPDCSSFSFINTGPNWQMAAVANINFLVVVLGPNGADVSHFIEYPQPMLFGGPRNLAVGNTNITPGMAASLSTRVLAFSMKEIANKYAHIRVSSTLLHLYFEERLKHNYRKFLPGGRVDPHPQSYPVNVIPTLYQSSAYGDNSCE